MLTSWRSLLGSMAAKVSAAADSHTAIDIRQLQGLAEQQDTEAFLPLRQEELGPQLPRRVIDLTRLVDDVVSRVKKTGWVSIKGRARIGYGDELRYLAEVPPRVRGVREVQFVLRCFLLPLGSTSRYAAVALVVAHPAGLAPQAGAATGQKPDRARWDRQEALRPHRVAGR